MTPRPRNATFAIVFLPRILVCLLSAMLLRRISDGRGVHVNPVPMELAVMTVRSIDHVLLAMPPGKEAEARAFYQGVLGIPELVKPANVAVRGGCWFGDGALKIHLG